MDDDDDLHDFLNTMKPLIFCLLVMAPLIAAALFCLLIKEL